MKLRFAPSPTGHLHVGNARVALANALFARRHGAAFLLRIDDTDFSRNRTDELVPGIEADLSWLGIGWDESFRQSDRVALYEEAADRLRESGRLYACFESEEELRSKREARIRAGKPPVYDRGALLMTAENGKQPYWRFLLSGGSTGWNDMASGPRTVKLPPVSDPVLIRADGTVLYTFASVVDDLATGVTHIIRGEDHVVNTGVQIDLAAALGAAPDRFRFAHLPLLLDEHGEKLSKRTGGVSLRSLRADGIEAGALASYLARLGTSDDPVPLTFDELAASQDLGHVSRTQPRFDPRPLLALNRHVLAATPFDAVADRLPPGAGEEFWNAVRANLDLFGEVRAWWDVVAGEIVAPPLAGEGGFLREAAAFLPDEPWDETTWERWTGALKASSGRRGRALFHPLRLALTGEESGPELKFLLPLMGSARVRRRLALPDA